MGKSDIACNGVGHQTVKLSGFKRKCHKLCASRASYLRRFLLFPGACFRFVNLNAPSLYVIVFLRPCSFRPPFFPPFFFLLPSSAGRPRFPGSSRFDYSQKNACPGFDGRSNVFVRQISLVFFSLSLFRGETRAERVAFLIALTLDLRHRVEVSGHFSKRFAILWLENFRGTLQIPRFDKFLYLIFRYSSTSSNFVTQHFLILFNLQFLSSRETIETKFSIRFSFSLFLNFSSSIQVLKADEFAIFFSF